MLLKDPIFLDPEEDASEGTFFLGAYFSPGHSNFKVGPGTKTFSQLVLDVKKPKPQQMNFQWRWNHMKRAVEYFRSKLDPLLGKGFAIAIVPPSKSGPNRSGMPELARQLAANGRIDASGCLVRHTDIPAQHEGGARSFEQHLATIRVDNADLIRGKKVLLLDDVGTTGTSLRACKQLLLDAGATAVNALRSGKPHIELLKGMIDTLHILTLLSSPGIGRRTVRSILSSAPSFVPSHAQELRDLLLEAKNQFPKTPIPTNSELDTAYGKAELILEQAGNLGLRLIGLYNPDFPERLNNIPDPPVLLYVKGNAECLSPAASVAVIGTRNPTEFGKRSAERIGAALAAKGIVVISGLASGCDTGAHQGCVNAGGQTVAVLAHGLDRVYPKENSELAENILGLNGCLVSEYAPGTPPRGNLFVERDRLQSGLSDAVIVIETDVKGGTMHTVKFALEQKRLLGCLDHPSRFVECPQARGNQMLVAEKKAVPLGSREEIDSFIAQFHKPAVSITPATDRAPDEGVEATKGRQLSFFSDSIETI